MRNTATTLFSCLAVFLLALLTDENVNAQSLTPRPNVSMTSNTNGYYEYLPIGYTTGNQTYPLMIFMEGLGEMGDGSAAQIGKLLDNGPLYYINAGDFPTSFTVNGKTSSFIIITPQYIQLPVTPSEVDSVITYAVQHYRVNTSMIYVTGLSMGGGQTWDYVGASSVYANRVAAIVPFASATEPSLSVVIPKARTIAAANLPVWAFHNQFDDVSDTITTNYIKYINQAPAPNPLARATIFNATGHDCWSPAYYGSYTENNLNIYQWMLQYSRGSAPPPPVNKPPVANAGTAQTITLPVSTATLTGSGSDPDGTVASYKWSYVSGPSSYTITSPTQAQTTVTNLVQGSYVFQLTVTDNLGATGTSNVNVTVNAAANQPPVANAGAAQTITLPVSTVTLTGSGSDPDGTVASYKWSYVSGPSLYTITSPTQAPTTVTNLVQGSYVFQLTVTDNLGATGTSNVNVTVNAAANQPPVANAGAAQTITLPVSSATLTGSGSDPDGTVASYKWSYVSGPASYTITSPTQAQTTVTNLVQGSYVFQLTVTDNLGATGTSNVSVTVNAAPAPPPAGNYVSVPGKIEAEAYSAMSGVQNENTTDAGGGQDVGYIDPTDWMEYKINCTSAGTYSVDFRVASPASNAMFEVRKSDGSVLATVHVPNTGGYQTWQTVNALITLPIGQQTIRIVSTGPQWNNWNFNWLNFSLSSSVPPPPPPVSSVLHIEAENYVAMSGVQTESTSDVGGGLDVGYIDPTDWMDYNVTVPAAGSYTVSFRVASVGNNAQLQLRKADGTVLTTVNLPNTGGYQIWQTVSAVVTLPIGQQTLRIISTGAQWNNWNINWLELAPSSATPPPPPPPPTPSPNTLHIEAENFVAMSGVQTESTSDVGGGLDVGYIDPTDWMDYTVNISAAGTYTVSFRIATPASNAQLQLRSADGTILATVNLPNTGGYQTWQTVKAVISLPSGQQTLRVVSTSPQWNNWNINWTEIASGTLSAIALNDTRGRQNATINLYPNPVRQFATLSLDHEFMGAIHIRIYTLSGTLVTQLEKLKTQPGKFQVMIDASQLRAGNYIIQMNMSQWKGTAQFIKIE